MGSLKRTAALALLATLVACAEGDQSDVAGPEALRPHFYAGGISGHSGAPNTVLCNDCHSSNGTAPSVTLSGPTALNPGQTGDYTLEIVPANGSDQQQGGLNVAVPSGGTLIAGSGTKILDKEIVHSSPQSGSGTLRWDFQWRAPASGGSYNMYGVGLSTNGSGRSGDEQGTDMLTITVQASNSPPSADSKQVETNVNTAVVIALSGSDAETCNLTFAIVSPPAHGSLSGITDQACGSGTDQARVTYTPNTDFTGSDQLTYSVTDGDGATAQATVDINVIAAGNSEPNADSKNVEVDINAPTAIVLSGSDAETCELNFAIVSGPSNGSLGSIVDQGCSGSTDQAEVTYTPDTDFTGSDQFTYSVTDGDGASAQATVNVNVSDPAAVDYALVRVRARANKDLKLEAAFIIKNNGNRQQGPALAELYVDDPDASKGGPACTMPASDEPGKGSTAFWFAPYNDCDVPLDTKGAPADYTITIRLVDQSPDMQTDVVHIRRISKIRGVMSAIRNALRGGG